jgi:hypothetical protein
MTCSKVFSGDLPELTSDIIQYFQNDLSTLHSCILVNRLWCRLAIPLLWEDPFSKKYPKNYHFIDKYLHKLNEDDKVKLNGYGIIDDIFSSNILFNYPSFIKRLSISKVCCSIKGWAKNNRALKIKKHGIFSTEVPKFDENLEFLRFVFLSLIKIFIENEVNLNTFEVEILYTLGVINNDCFESAFQLFLQNPNFICNIKNLNIYFNGPIGELSFLKYFYSNCKSISSLYIHFSIDGYAENDLSKVINSQQNLKKIYIDLSNYSLRSLKNSNCSNTLKTIIFHKINLDKLAVNFNEVFEQLNVLESIHILYCYPLNSSIIQKIINLTKPFKLKSLFMDGNSKLQVDQLELLLQKSGNYLENIKFESSMNNELKLQMFKLFKIYCNKIKFIDLLGFDDQNIFSALDLIKNVQQNLNYLTINFCRFGYYQSNYDDKLSSIVLQNLGQVLPYKLEYLNLVLEFTVKDLEVFLKNSQDIFINKLLIRNKVYHKSENILSCIKKYVMKEKKVKYLAIEHISGFSFYKWKDLFYLKNEVEEFKFYGIQVADYNDLCIQVCDFINKLY